MKFKIIAIHFFVFLLLSLIWFFISDFISRALNPNYYNVEISFTTFKKGELLLLIVVTISCIIFLNKRRK